MICYMIQVWSMIMLFSENLSVLIQTSLVSYDGLNNLNYGEYLEDVDFEVLDIFVNWLETNKGKYEL